MSALRRRGPTSRRRSPAAPPISPARSICSAAIDLFTGEGSNFGGFQAGYNTVFKSGLLLGVEADISFPGNMSGTSTLATPSIGTATYSDLVEMSGSVRGRIGYAFDRWLYYGTAGYAWTADRLTRTQLSDNPAGASGGTVEIKLPTRSGWTVGAGVEAPLVPHWTARLEYLYSGFRHRQRDVSSGRTTFRLRTFPCRRFASG